MTKFAFIIHPLELSDIYRKYGWLRWFPKGLVERIIPKMKPKVVSHITGIKSATGATTEGWFIGCPLTSKMLVGPDQDTVLKVLVECCRLAEEVGAKVIGLGAFTSVAGDGGLTLRENVNIEVTTGNSYTVETAIEGALEAARLLEIDVAHATLGVVGATGSIGRVCAEVLAPKFCSTILIGRDLPRTQELAAQLPRATASNNPSDLRNADVVITVTSAAEAVILPEHLKPGSVICDVARPRDVSVRVVKERDDVLVIEGGVVAIPGDVEFNFNFGFPEKTAYACMSETMLLALEDRPCSFTLGKEVSVEQVLEMKRLADKHGFHIAGFRSFERAVDTATIERVKKARQVQPSPSVAASQP